VDITALIQVCELGRSRYVGLICIMRDHNWIPFANKNRNYSGA
jgi:hypothetical protein